ncbi:MAG: hypothetical protein KDA87_20360 [Planctomycetales bacterium]|nr:hypothetical protein [Planctomycetales bacterium]
MAEEVNAKKDTKDAEDALALAKTVKEIYAAKGKKIVHYDLKKDAPDDEALKKIMLGPTGNLRAPTLRIGKILLIGFDQDTYDQLLG